MTQVSLEAGCQVRVPSAASVGNSQLSREPPSGERFRFVERTQVSFSFPIPTRQESLNRSPARDALSATCRRSHSFLPVVSRGTPTDTESSIVRS